MKGDVGGKGKMNNESKVWRVKLRVNYKLQERVRRREERETEGEEGVGE